MSIICFRKETLGHVNHIIMILPILGSLRKPLVHVNHIGINDLANPMFPKGNFSPYESYLD